MLEDVALGIFAHPDDAELVCAGTLSLLKNAGWKIHIATMTPGDKGSAELDREEISRIRRAEAATSASLIDAVYHCLEMDDLFIMYNRESIIKTTELLRKVKPRIVFTASPNDYMIDHETTSLIVQSACFGAGIRNLEVALPPHEMVPYLYYSDALEGKDKFGNPVSPAFYVDISDDMEIKEGMLACHDSQRSWLRHHHKMDEYITSMKRFAEHRGNEVGVTYAEGFRQHLGHGYPQDNILVSILRKKVITIN